MSSSGISASLPSLDSFSEYIEDEPGKSDGNAGNHIRLLKDLRLACLALYTLGMLIKTAMMIVNNSRALLSATFWVVTTVCTVSFAVNSYLILSSTEETDKLKEGAKQLAMQVHNSIGKRLWG